MNKMKKMNKFESYSGFLPWFMALLLSVLAAGCGGGGDGGRDPILGTGAGTGGVVGPGPGPGPVPGPVGCFALTSTLANFGVLGGTSLTCNASPPGTVLITGDIGAPTQSCIPPQTAGFANYSNVGDPQLVTALADLQTATAAGSNAGTCPCATTLGATDLGGLTRTPGTYCFTGAINLTGTFTLNGPGVYIFRTTSTLDTVANSIVQFANGATDANTSVYWIAVGATTLGANSVFKGTVMTSAAAITMGNNATLIRGRVLSGAAVTLANNQVVIP